MSFFRGFKTYNPTADNTSHETASYRIAELN